MTDQLTLVIGGNGKTGRRLVQRLTAEDRPVRIGSRSGGVPFDWDDPATWEPALANVEEDFAASMAAEGVPDDVVELLTYLFTSVLDGRNAQVCDGVQRVLGRPARDFADYARDTAATGIWN